MKGDIGFVGFMLTADEWQELDAQSRAQLIAVATRRIGPSLERPRRFPEGTGPHEVVEMLDADLLEDDDLAAELESEIELLEIEDLEENKAEPPAMFAPESLLTCTDADAPGQPWFAGDGAVPLLAADMNDDELFAGVDKMLDDQPALDASLDAADTPPDFVMPPDDEISFADLFDD